MYQLFINIGMQLRVVDVVVSFEIGLEERTKGTVVADA